MYGEPNERKLGEGSTKQIKSEKEKGGEKGVHILLLLVDFRNFMNSQFELKLTLREGKGNILNSQTVSCVTPMTRSSVTSLIFGFVLEM